MHVSTQFANEEAGEHYTETNPSIPRTMHRCLLKFQSSLSLSCVHIKVMCFTIYPPVHLSRILIQFLVS